MRPGEVSRRNPCCAMDVRAVTVYGNPTYRCALIFGIPYFLFKLDLPPNHIAGRFPASRIFKGQMSNM